MPSERCEFERWLLRNFAFISHVLFKGEYLRCIILFSVLSTFDLCDFFGGVRLNNKFILRFLSEIFECMSYLWSDKFSHDTKLLKDQSQFIIGLYRFPLFNLVLYTFSLTSLTYWFHIINRCFYQIFSISKFLQETILIFLFVEWNGYLYTDPEFDLTYQIHIQRFTTSISKNDSDSIFLIIKSTVQWSVWDTCLIDNFSEIIQYG